MIFYFDRVSAMMCQKETNLAFFNFNQCDQCKSTRNFILLCNIGVPEAPTPGHL